MRNESRVEVTYKTKAKNKNSGLTHLDGVKQILTLSHSRAISWYRQDVEKLTKKGRKVQGGSTEKNQEDEVYRIVKN
jgi:hypothetical protein